MSCDCIKTVNAYLAEHNLRLVTTLFRPPDVCIVQTEKLDPKSRKPTPVLLADYCPFCGTRQNSSSGLPESAAS